MYRTVPYIVLFLILALLQIFLFDNLSISIYLCPLVYIGFIVLSPIDAPPVAVLFLALSMSVAMDWAMGAAGDQYDRYASGRYLCADRFCSLSAVRTGFGRAVFLLRSGWGRADFCATW